MTPKHLRLVVFQDGPGIWHARGLEHDLAAEGSTIGQAVRSLARMLQVHADYDTRHDHPALVAFPPSAQRYWNAFATGTAVPLATLGIQPPDGWIFQAAFAIRLPGESAHQAAAELRTKSLELRTRSGSSFLSS